MISLQKSMFAFEKDVKESVIDQSELDFGRSSGGINYAEKLAVKGLTFAQMQGMYEIHVWVRACIDITVDRATDVTPLVKPIQFEVDDKGEFKDDLKKDLDNLSSIVSRPNQNSETFTDFQKKLFNDILKFDAGAFELVRSTFNGGGVELYAVSGKTVKLNKDKRGLFKDKSKAFIQLDPDTMEHVADWPQDKLCYMMRYPQSDKIYGISPLESLVSTITADLYAESFNMDFFTNQATPRFAVMFEGLGQQQSGPTLKRMRDWWDQELKGKFHRPILLTTEGTGKINFQKVGLTNEEMQFQQYSKWLLQKVMAIYKVQPIVLGLIDENMGKLNSEEQVRIFKANALKPLLQLFADKFNYGVTWASTGLNKRTVYLDYDLDLVDKKTQAEWHDTYLQDGVLTINEIRVKGLGLPPVPWGNVPYLQNNLTPFGQSADGTTTAVPPIPAAETSITQTPTETTMAPTSISAKDSQGRWLTKKNWEWTTKQQGKAPIGWENIPPTERMAIIESIYLERQKELSTKYFYRR